MPVYRHASGLTPPGARNGRTAPRTLLAARRAAPDPGQDGLLAPAATASVGPAGAAALVHPAGVPAAGLRPGAGVPAPGPGVPAASAGLFGPGPEPLAPGRPPGSGQIGGGEGVLRVAVRLLVPELRHAEDRQ